MLFEPTDPGEPPDTDGSETPSVTLPKDTDLAKYLRSKGIEKVVMVGLATDYWYVALSGLVWYSLEIELTVCLSVLETALASLSAGFDTLIVEPAIRGIYENQVKAAYRKMEGAGGKLVGRNGESWEGAVKQWVGAEKHSSQL